MVVVVGPLLTRSRICAALSRAFLYPKAELTRELVGGNFEALLRNDLLTLPGADRLAPELERFCKLLRTSPDLEAEYQRLFGGQTPACPPYETEYTAAHVWMQTQQMADIAGFYRAFGVDSQEIGERVDALATELEFLYLLFLKEAVALNARDGEAAEVCRDARCKFLAEHLNVWLPRFRSRLSQVTQDEGFYPALAALTERFIALEAGRDERRAS